MFHVLSTNGETGSSRVKEHDPRFHLHELDGFDVLRRAPVRLELTVDDPENAHVSLSALEGLSWTASVILGTRGPPLTGARGEVVHRLFAAENLPGPSVCDCLYDLGIVIDCATITREVIGRGRPWQRRFRYRASPGR